MQNYYEILQVNQNASQEVIDKAYRVLAKQYHPDVQPRDKVFWAEAQLKQINAAYDVLSDPSKREEYNMSIGLSHRVENSQEYQNLYSEKEQLEQELNNLKSEKDTKKGVLNKLNPFGGKGQTNYNVNNRNLLSQLNLKEGFRGIGQTLYNETKKSKEERSKDIKAMIITVIIMAFLIFLFLKVPFLRHLLSL